MVVLRKRKLTHQKNTSHGGKRSKKNPKKTIISSLPKDLLVDVLARIGSSSFTDLFNAKQCCKDFLGATEEDYVIQRISIDKFPIIPWFPQSDKERSFLMNCFNKGNPEALFRKGMIEYFSLGGVESGLENLKKASMKGHMEATYVYGIFLLSQGDEQSEQGLNLLNSMRNSKPRCWDFGECRNKIKRYLNAMWINNKIKVQADINIKCQKKDHGVSCLRRLQFSEDKAEESCDSCMWYREFILFCEILNICP